MTVEPCGRLITSPLGSKEDLLRNKVALYNAYNVLHVLRVLLKLQKLPNPGKPFLKLLLAGNAELILPVGCDTVFGCLVHLPCAYLHLEGDALLAYNGGVKGLVHVGLRG